MALPAKVWCILFVACSLIVQETMASQVICEKLPTRLCSFAVSSLGSRCVLENENDVDICKTSEIESNKFAAYIESDKCVNACGVDRLSVGISFDDLLVEEFAARFCSPACYQNCPNLVELFFNAAAEEGISLPAMCEKVKEKSMPPASSAGDRREARDLLSAAAPESGRRATLGLVSAPASAPAHTDL